MEYRYVEGSPDYIVTDSGHIYSTKPYAGVRLRELKYEIQKAGHLRVALCMGGHVIRYLVHRLVADAFIPNPACLPMVDHIDRNPANNNVNNLRWVTASDNERNKGNKRILCTSLEGVFVAEYPCIQAAVDYLFSVGVTTNVGAKAHICSCCRGRIPHIYGYRWQYAE